MGDATATFLSWTVYASLVMGLTSHNLSPILVSTRFQLWIRVDHPEDACLSFRKRLLAAA